MLKFLAALAFLNAMPCFAVSNGELEVGLSIFTPPYNKYASKSGSGYESPFGFDYYDLRAQYHWAVFDSVFFSPELGLMHQSLLAKKAPDGGSKSFKQYLFLPAVYNLSPMFDLTFGFGLLRHNVVGSGGNTQMPNGTGTSTFGLPSGTVTSTTVPLILGSAVNYNSFRGGLNLLIEGAASSKKRSMSLMFTFGYKFKTK